MKSDNIVYTHVALYVGIKIELAKGGKYAGVHEWVIVSEDPEHFDFTSVDASFLTGERKVLNFKGSNIVKSANPGNMYKLAYAGEGQGWYTNGYFVGQLVDKVIIQKLQIQHQTASYHLREQGRKAKDLEKNWIFENLEPIRDVYKRSNAHIKTLILAYVIRRITS